MSVLATLKTRFSLDKPVFPKLVTLFPSLLLQCIQNIKTLTKNKCITLNCALSLCWKWVIKVI